VALDKFRSYITSDSRSSRYKSLEFLDMFRNRTTSNSR
jgi:hypothetical protein